jgi:hypothetical protein
MIAFTDKPEPQNVETMKALERFVVENDDLLTLESRVGRFNIFDALRITRAEIRHSNFLAFILDPAESHGQGQRFLKAVLMDLLKSAPADLRPLSPIELDGTDLRGVEVKREWKHTDLLIKCQEPPFVVVIENKIGSKEGPDQLSRYEARVKKHFPGVRALYVYLTLNADDPSEEAWVPYSHTDIHRVLMRVRETCGNAMGDDVLVFLDHYLDLIGARFMNDEQIDELCQRIYKNHRRALDLIWERVGSPESGVMADVANVLGEDHRWEVIAGPRNCIRFMPKAWLDWLPQLGLKGDPRSWIFVNLHLSNGIGYAVEMAPMKDLEKRREIVPKLLEKCPEFGFKRPQVKAQEVKNNYSRISTFERFLELAEDEEPEPDAIRVCIKKMLDGLYPKLEKLGLVLKTLL